MGKPVKDQVQKKSLRLEKETWESFTREVGTDSSGKAKDQRGGS